MGMEYYGTLLPGYVLGRLRYDLSPDTPRRTTVVLSDLRDDGGALPQYGALVPEKSIQRLGNDRAVYPSGAEIASVDASGNITPEPSFAYGRVVDILLGADTGDFAAGLYAVYIITASGPYSSNTIYVMRGDGVYWLDDTHVLVATTSFDADAVYRTQPIFSE